MTKKSIRSGHKRPHEAFAIVHDGTAESQICDILPWKFFVYATQEGGSDVQQAINRLNELTSARFEAIVRHLAPTPRGEWHRPQAAKLKGFEDLFELRFNDGNVPCRPTGFFGPDQGNFTITLWITKNRNGYHPPDAFKIANSRKKAILAGEACAIPLQIDGEIFPPVPE